MWARAAAGGGSREGSGIRVITDMMARDLLEAEGETDTLDRFFDIIDG